MAGSSAARRLLALLPLLASAAAQCAGLSGCSACVNNPSCYYCGTSSGGSCLANSNYNCAYPNAAIVSASQCQLLPTCASYSSCGSCASLRNCEFCSTFSSFSSGYCLPYTNPGTSCLGTYKAVYSSQCGSNAPTSNDDDTVIVSAQASGINEIATGETAAGIVLAVVITLLISAFHIFRLQKVTALRSRSVAAEQWADQAEGSWRLVTAALCLQCFGIASGIAAIAIPWYNGGYSVRNSSSSASVYLIMSGLVLDVRACASTSSAIPDCASLSVPNVLLLPGALVVLLGLTCFAFPAWLLSFEVTFKLVRLSKFREMPSSSPCCCCCFASLPSVQGLSWFGYSLTVLGAWWMLAWLQLVYDLLPRNTARTLSAGGSMLIVSLVACFVANMLYSVAGCCRIGSLPGVGMRRGNCCCTEVEGGYVINNTALPVAAISDFGGLYPPPGMSSHPIAAVMHVEMANPIRYVDHRPPEPVAPIGQCSRCTGFSPMFPTAEGVLVCDSCAHPKQVS